MLHSIFAFLGSHLWNPFWNSLGFTTTKFLDPDRKLFSLDKLEHFVGVGLLTWGLCVILPNVEALGFAVGFAVIFELGQWDVLRTAAPEKLGTPGYGFGLLDVLCGAAGATTVVLWLAISSSL